MERSCILIFSILIALNCSAQQELQGLWNSSWVENIPTPGFADAPFYSVYHNSDLYFEGDSLWRLEYPCKRISVEKYSSIDFKFVNDSTFDYNEERYSRVNNYDPNSISRLKTQEINPECYAGKWTLIRSESGGDGTGSVFIYPFKIANSISLKSNDLNGGVLKLFIGGAKREFYFRMERIDFNYQLILTPTESWRKEDKIMWTRYWELPPPERRELKKIKQSEGIALELRFYQK